MGFFEKVYRLVRKIPSGKVTTYGEIARALGSKDARRVGYALHANKDSQTPCHRVVDKNGRLAPNFGGPFAFSGRAGSGFARDGWKEQRRRLEAEGVEFKDPPSHEASTSAKAMADRSKGQGEMHVDLKKYLYVFR